MSMEWIDESVNLLLLDDNGIVTVLHLYLYSLARVGYSIGQKVGILMPTLT